MQNTKIIEQGLIDKNMKPDTIAYLNKYFGFQTFKTGQQAVIEKVLGRKNTLAVMPTGGGKSLCYQLPALIFKGTTIVVSPLISLMKDQIDDLTNLFIKATFINSSISAKEQEKRIKDTTSGKYKLLYIAPERFRSKKFTQMLKETKIELFAIDEAHCISTWGHDFRPDYLSLKHFIKLMGNPPVIALTATATPEVQKDIVKQLDIPDAQTIVTGFDRENLIFSVINTPAKKDKNAVLKDALRHRHGSAIIYVGTRRKTENVSAYLNSIGVKSSCYHAGIDDSERENIQNKFMNGEIPVLVATNAFGMGIDKDDIRCLIHLDIPGNIESYYQEAGRAGRDGKQAWCILLYSPSDIKLQEYFIAQNHPTKQQVHMVHNYLINQNENPVSKTREEIKKSLNIEISEQGISSTLRILRKAGAIDLLSRFDNIASVKFRTSPETILKRQKSKLQKTLTSAIMDIGKGDKDADTFSFSFRDLIKSANLKSDQISRTLNNMDKLNLIKYSSPFRGRSILIKDFNTPFDELNILWEKMEAQRNHGIKKLHQIIQYATSHCCRRKMLLEYFGEKYEKDLCPGCDVCIGREILEDEPTFEEAAYTIQEAKLAENLLRCVKEIPQPLIKIRIAQILTGSKAIVIKQNGFDKLKTYETTKESQEKTMEILQRLISEGFLKLSGVEHPVILLNKKGSDILLGRKEFKIIEIDKDASDKTSSKNEIDQQEEALLIKISKNPEDPEILFEAGNFYLEKAKFFSREGKTKNAISFSEQGSTLLQKVLEDFPASSAARKISTLFRQRFENLSHKEIDTDPIVNNIPSCPRCSSKMVLREGEFGRFWGCSEYPYCRGTHKY